ncbi:MAG: hypothetical protein LBG59_00355 [Candidatus Peribacteria bacterium]|nr:hypothetical protein [Candidatus Peribacteria bacterium]
MQTTLSEQDVVRLKDALYSFDLWIFRGILEKLPLQKMKKLYTDQSLLNIFASLRELFPGFLLYYHFILTEDKKQKKSTEPDHLFGFFFGDILGLDVSLSPAFQELIPQLLEEFGFALTLFTEFDDNKEFFKLLWENWKHFMKGKEHFNHKELGVYADDLLRLRGALKHITYYNKRYLIPG